MPLGELRRNSLILVLSSGGGAVLALVLTLLIGRGWGETGLGVYAAALAWVYPLSLLAELGIGTWLIREVAADQTRTADYLQAALPLRWLIGGGLAVWLWLISPHVSMDATIVAGLRIAAPLILIYPLFSLYSAVFRAHQAMLPIAYLNIGMLVIQVGMTLVALGLGATILMVLWLNTLTSLGQLAAAWVWYRWRYTYTPIQPIASTRLLKQATPFALAAILAAWHTRLGLVILEASGGAAAVGYFSAAVRFIEALLLLSRAFFDALFPLLAALAADRARLRRLFGRINIGLALIGSLSSLMLMMGSAWLIPLVYGSAFVPSVQVLVISALSLPPALLKSAYTVYGYALGRETAVNRITLATLALRLALSLWLIPLYGSIGAAWVAVVVEVMAWLGLWLSLRH